MAETQQQGNKRQRDETLIAEELEEPKRRKSYNQILSFLDEEDQDDDDSNHHDVSSIFSTLQRELSFDDPILANTDHLLPTPPESGTCPGSDLGSATIGKSIKSAVEDEEEEEEDEDRLMKRLLEATDDELGIPNGGPPPVTGAGSGNDEDGNGRLVMDGGDEFGLLSSCGGLWELEDEAANYYTWFQSELFM